MRSVGERTETATHGGLPPASGAQPYLCKELRLPHTDFILPILEKKQKHEARQAPRAFLRNALFQTNIFGVELQK